MDDFSLFYAWQSDTPAKIGRYLIRDAAKCAVSRLGKDVTVEESPRLDSDTQNTPGTPDIASTIFDKIDSCALMLADVTFVGSTSERDGKSKMLPNPNVLLELGYGAASVGWDRVILVMNTAYGSPDNLIFDLRNRRFPLTFELSETGKDAVKEQADKLSKSIEFAIRAGMQAEHAAVDRIIGKLDIGCFQWMEDAGKQEDFHPPQRRKAGEILGNLSLDNSLIRLLELGVIRCTVKHEGKLYGYYWTYLGKLVLRKLGLGK